MGYSKYIHFVGQDDDVEIYFSRSDSFFLSSRSDCFLSVVLEAYKQFTPVVMFDNTSGTVEIAVNNCAIIVQYADTKEAARALIFLMYEDNYIASNTFEFIEDKTFDSYID